MKLIMTANFYGRAKGRESVLRSLLLFYRFKAVLTQRLSMIQIDRNAKGHLVYFARNYIVHKSILGYRHTLIRRQIHLKAPDTLC